MARILTPAALRDLEAELFPGHEAAAPAMEEAGTRLAQCLEEHYPGPGTLFLVLGGGNNAGDALVAARHLTDRGWACRTWWSPTGREPSPLCLRHAQAMEGRARPLDPDHPGVIAPGPRVVVDGLVGLNARLPLSPPLAHGARVANRLRDELGAATVAVDIPSGLDPATGEPGEDCVVADLTVTMAAPKDILLADAALDVVGRLAILHLDTVPVPDDPGADLVADARHLAPLLPPRPHSLHKGSAGRVVVLAGSPGMTGAAVLTASGAAAAGAGLVTVLTHPDALAGVAAACPPHLMVRPVPTDLDHELLATLGDACVAGPGCGRSLDHLLPGLIRHTPLPMVVDADALNALTVAGAPAPVRAPAPRLLTPHPGEFSRLAPDLKGLPRAAAARAFADRWSGCTLLLKGGRTLVTEHGRPLAYNPTGNHALATGGTGDFLAGMAAAFLARGCPAQNAALLAAWLHGRAAELACSHGYASSDSFVAPALEQFLGAAFTSLRRRSP